MSFDSSLGLISSLTFSSATKFLSVAYSLRRVSTSCSIVPFGFPTPGASLSNLLMKAEFVRERGDCYPNFGMPLTSFFVGQIYLQHTTSAIKAVSNIANAAPIIMI